MTKFNELETRDAHPGWVVKFEDGTWLGGAHGWFRTDDPFYADWHETIEDAERNITSAKKTGSDYNLPYTIAPAWEYLCEHLRFSISELRNQNKLYSKLTNLKPDDLLDVVEQLEGCIYTLKNLKNKNIK